MSEHTPGPWCACEPLPDHAESGPSQRIHAHIECNCTQAENGGPSRKAHGRAVRYLPYTEADERLIAAAPDLLAALLEIAKEAHDYDQLGPANDHRFAYLEGVASAAIAKAEGRS